MSSVQFLKVSKGVPRFFAILFLSLSLFSSAYAIPGFSYKKSCQQTLNGNSSPLEILKRSLPGSSWPESSKSNFTFMEFNVLNMIDHVDAGKMQDGGKFIANGHGGFAKPLAQLEGIARVFKKHKPLLAFCVEIGSVKVLKDYDQEFLGNQYEEFSIEGNDPRGVDVGLLLRKDLPLDVEVQSHKNLIDETTGQLVFSRDLPVYILREKGSDSPLLIVFGTHFKSQRSTDGDPLGMRKRTLQAKAASLIIADYEQRYPGVPMILTGDFNNDVRRAAEFAPLRNIGLVDSFDLAADTVPPQDRGTHFYFPRKGPSSVNQLDSIMLNKAAAQKVKVKSAKVLTHIDPQGNDYPPPKSYGERETRASDHLPILSILDLQ